MKLEIEQKGNLVHGIKMDALQETLNALSDNSELGQCRFHIRNEWISAGHNKSEISSFYGACQEIDHKERMEVHCDEPPILGSNDEAPNPVEHLLNALAGCVTSSIIYHAAANGIHIDELESELEGDLDIRGFAGLSDDVRVGYKNIRINFKVRTDEQDLDKLKELARFSPVLDVTRNGTDVDIQFERK